MDPEISVENGISIEHEGFWIAKFTRDSKK